jgi:hypothetical protein
MMESQKHAFIFKGVVMLLDGSDGEGVEVMVCADGGDVEKQRR